MAKSISGLSVSELLEETEGHTTDIEVVAVQLAEAVGYAGYDVVVFLKAYMEKLREKKVGALLNLVLVTYLTRGTNIDKIGSKGTTKDSAKAADFMRFCNAMDVKQNLKGYKGKDTSKVMLLSRIAGINAKACVIAANKMIDIKIITDYPILESAIQDYLGSSVKLPPACRFVGILSLLPMNGENLNLAQAIRFVVLIIQMIATKVYEGKSAIANKDDIPKALKNCRLVSTSNLYSATMRNDFFETIRGMTYMNDLDEVFNINMVDDWDESVRNYIVSGL